MRKILAAPLTIALLCLAACASPAPVLVATTRPSASRESATPTPAVQVAVPNVVGMTVRDASSALDAAQLTLETRPNSEYLVVAQVPAAGASVDVHSSVSVSADPPPVVYSITSNGSTANSITYMNTSGEAQVTNVPLPWSMSVPQRAPLGYIVLAQDGNGTSITCTITIGSKVVATNTSTGRFSIAQCMAPR